MLCSDLDNQVQAFFQQLTQEILDQSRQVNESNQEDLQDGICTQFITDGWVSYKGMSWGVAVQDQPAGIAMTFGPDWPFVGYKQVFEPRSVNGQIIWTDKKENQSFASASELAQYGLESLAAKVHDSFSKIEKVEKAAS